MTKPPCYSEEYGDCEQRCVGCKGKCKAWQDWLIIHEKEKSVIRRNKAAEHELAKYMVEQSKRKELAYKREYSKEYRRRYQ